MSKKIKNKKFKSVNFEYFKIKDIAKVHASFDVIFQDVFEKHKFINKYLDKNDDSAYISNVSDGFNNIYFMSYEWGRTNYNLGETCDEILEEYFEGVHQLIISIQDLGDVEELDKLIRKRFKSELPFAGMKVIFVNTYLDNYFSEKGEDKIKLINIEV